MRFAVSAAVVVTSAVAVATATEDACSQMCSEVDGCRGSKYGSYCKGWMTPSICFGLVRRTDGSYCFQPGDVNCVGEAVPCSMGHVTTAEPTESPLTTAVPATKSASTTSASIATTATEVNTTAAPTTTAQAVTTTPVETTTNTVGPITTTTATTTRVTTTTTATTPKATTTTTATTRATTTTMTTTKATTTTAASPAFGGHYCGSMMGQSFTVDFASNGRATINVMGMSAGADYTVDGDDIEFSNYDPMLAKLMQQFHIKKIDATIISPDSVHIKIGFLLDTTITKC
ncbi:merozoite surface protein 2, putative [Perkinsus marinus ATCC 50983]|uniref:Merozoite surface protein 2, putative n=1 Tax=Perkinsus marinus (strain ATCC 50983 / TXsc) TaxID=423536 RepID=C5KH30_PERM5|nr:merozoite surface protein 2, putative [Perkinsus marinus ATCC 50983]EER15892.1 merozoite surface protein 2, putative [Perkinsus marinus ATCC 50983]|eukprot:XP_002784096.1 merozoite surface protein 2, putative [Perkinsus marinus ATCC 50983]